MSNRNVPVSAFNAGSVSLRVSVNNGNQVSIAGTGPGQNWAPQTSNALTFNEGYPGPGSLGFGRNTLQVSASDMSTEATFSLEISQSQRVDSLQLYIFLSNSSAVAILLNGGQLIALTQQ